MPPLSLLIKPASGLCNMRCRYCFYTDEAANRSTPNMGIMSLDTMHTLVDKAMAYADGSCAFVFQGGEPSLAGIEFFRAFSERVNTHPNPKHLQISYCFQTNGYAIDEQWCQWFAENKVLVGISLDGPKEIHDRYRVDTAGKGTFNKVMQTIRLLKKHNVDFNILTVVSAANARRGTQVYEFFKKQDFRWQQYIECLDPIGEVQGSHEYSLTPERYEAFLKSRFDAWYRDMVADRYVFDRYFENLLMLISGQQPEACSLRGVCQSQWVIEADGSVYPCDFYALDQWLLGNIHTHSFPALEAARRESGFIQMSAHLHPDCRSCKWLRLCRGGCRRNREPVTMDAAGKNYFCSAYQGFLEYAYPRLCDILSRLRRKAAQNR